MFVLGLLGFCFIFLFFLFISGFLGKIEWGIFDLVFFFGFLRGWWGYRSRMLEKVVESFILGVWGYVSVKIL